MSTSRFVVIVISLVSAAIVAICAVTIVLVLNPTSGSQEERSPNLVAVAPADDAEDQPHTEAGARGAAQKLFDAYAAGNYGAFWDGWTIDAQGLISRRDYARLFELCKPIAQGIRYNVQSAMVQGDTAKVQVTRLIGAFTYDFKYEDGRWRFIPEAETQADYRSKTVEQLAAEKQASRTCANSTAPPSAPPAVQPTTSAPPAETQQTSQPQAQPPAAGERKVLLTDNGNGRKNTQQFTVDASWALHYTYDCSKTSIGTGGMSATLLDGTKYVDLVVNETGASADKTTPQYNAGSFHLEITGPCPWTIEVVDVP
ncbi:hypothetical protein Ssi03_62800 [Sphaerisporangium siamense]|uniref:Uncharacterized protein n=1 Tax=Sphaerisporangium siamense TaxID=795645 RepID=A0A7W7DC04_9ACTN|nr:hypothetical protein [Sphaerisporangium siamense]MBB4702588.1 hypothetical protein [Sphaerisporangium siamense]GII88290.1 hypothetical protein Ssi03_62800 [Sphaerisporangium siamense]